MCNAVHESRSQFSAGFVGVKGFQWSYLQFGLLFLFVFSAEAETLRGMTLGIWMLSCTVMPETVGGARDVVPPHCLARWQADRE